MRTAESGVTARAIADAKSGARSTKAAGCCAAAGPACVVSTSAASVNRGHHSRPWKPTAANDSTPASVPFELRRTEATQRRRLEHVVGEEELAVHRHHHDLNLVGEPLGDDLLNQQRTFLEDLRL